MKWNKVCPICKREIPDEKIQSLVSPADTETAASTLTAVTDNNNTSYTENVPLLVTLHGASVYGSVAENNDEGFGDQHSLEPTAVHTREQYHQLSESSGGLSDAESHHSVAM